MKKRDDAAIQHVQIAMNAVVAGDGDIAQAMRARIGIAPLVSIEDCQKTFEWYRDHGQLANWLPCGCGVCYSHLTNLP